MSRVEWSEVCSDAIKPESDPGELPEEDEELVVVDEEIEAEAEVEENGQK